jgi:hypothetical protein
MITFDEFMAFCWLGVAISASTIHFTLVMRALDIWEKWVDNVKGKGAPTVGQFGAPASVPVQDRPQIKQVKVPELPPEAIAPGLRQPPKPAGFGPAPSGDGADSAQPVAEGTCGIETDQSAAKGEKKAIG